MDKRQAVELAEKYFKTHPAISVFHITSDGQAFFDKGNADNHVAGKMGMETFRVARIDVVKQQVVESIEAKFGQSESKQGQDESLKVGLQTEEKPEAADSKAADQTPDEDAEQEQEPVQKKQVQKKAKAPHKAAPKEKAAKA